MHSPITKTLPAGYYVGINQTVTYGSDRTLVLNNTAGITDTGTTLLLLASGMPTANILCGVSYSRYFL